MLEKLHIASATELCAASVTCGGRTFTPDEDNAYIAFRLSHSLPSMTVFRGGLHPATVAASWGTIVNKQFNFMHKSERGLGTILAAEFPDAPAGGWKIPAQAADAPGIRAVAVIHRKAPGAAAMIQLHADGEVAWEVSMEVEHQVDSGAFALPREGGWDFIACADAPAELRACLKPREGGGGRACSGLFEGVEPVLLWGGVPGLAGCAGKVRYIGTALCYRGAEPTNAVDQITASDEAVAPAGLAGFMRDAAAVLRSRARRGL